jgi:ribosomal protein L37AE/L43A
MSETQRQALDCPTCGAEIGEGEDFCHECGHSVEFAMGMLAQPEGELDSNAGHICPACGATHLVITAQGYPQCETCGYTERH